MTNTHKNRNRKEKRKAAASTMVDSAPDPALAAPALPSGASSDVPDSRANFSFAAPANAPTMPANAPTISVGTFRRVLDFARDDWKQRFHDLEARWQQRETEFVATVGRLEGQIMLTEAKGDVNVDEVTRKLQTANESIAELKAEIEALNSPEEEDDKSLSEHEGMASIPSNEIEESCSYEDGSFQTIDIPEEPVAMPKMSAEEVAELEAQLEDTRRLLKTAETELEGNKDYIKRTEEQAAEFEKKYEDEKVISADLKTQLDKAKQEIKAREEDISGENGLEERLAEAMAKIEEDLEPTLKQQVQFNKNLKEDLDKAKRMVKFYKTEADAANKTSFEVIKQEKKVEKQVEHREEAIEQLNDQIVDLAHFKPELYAHQKILEDTVAEINKSIEEGPKFNAHPDAYVAPENITPVAQSLSDQLAGLESTSGESRSFEELESDHVSVHTVRSSSSLPAEAENLANVNDEVYAEEQRTLDKMLRQAEIVEVEIKVPVEEVTAIPAGPALVPTPSETQPPPYVQPTAPSTPESPQIIIKEVDRFVFTAQPVHSWLHIERDFVVLVLAFFSYFTETLWPWFIQEVRGIAPISSNPVLVSGPEDDEETEAGDLQDPAALPQAQMNTAVATAAPGSSAPMNGAAPGSDPTDAQLGSGATETVDLAELLTPLPNSPDRRESIPPAPPISPKKRGSSSSNGRISPAGDGNGDCSGLPGPPSGDGNGSYPPGPPNGNGNGSPNGPPGPPNGDGYGGVPLPAPAASFWNVFARRPLPSIFWTLLGMVLHILVYYCVYLSIDTYFERNLWLGANDATRQWLHSIMGVRSNNGMLRKIFSDTWANNIDRSVLFAVTKAGIMELKTFPMPG